MPVPVPILLVDDEPRNLDALEAVLGGEGYSLLRAGDAQAALSLLLQNDVAAIVLDVKMPGIGGVDLTRMIKGLERYRQTPIVLLTAYTPDDAEVTEAYDAGAADFISKPVKPKIIRQKLRVFADLFRSSRALASLNEKLEDRVRERTADLARSAEQKDRFLAVLAHELRNPLAPLRTGLDLLRRRVQTTPSVERTFGTMDRQLDHMVRLINDLLDVARVTHGTLRLATECVDLREVIAKAIEATRPYFARRGQTVSVEDTTEARSAVDSVRIVQVLGNVLHNASKFTPPGGRVSVVLTSEGQQASVRVIDHGAGIERADLERVFEMFVHGERADGREQGLGIGLAIARQIAELHGGSLTAFSNGAGCGATFTLTLPLADEAAKRVEPAIAPAPKPDLGLRVVLIEDNEDVGQTLADWLETLGHQVWIASSGEAGMELVHAHAPNVVLCDLGLPGIDGLQVCERIRAMSLAPRPSMVAITGWGQEEVRRRTREAGFDEHLVKPVSPLRLEDVIRGLCSGGIPEHPSVELSSEAEIGS